MASAVQQATGVLAGLGLQIYLARTLTQSDFGTIAFIGSVLAMVMFLAQMGVAPLLAQRVARDHSSAPRWMARGTQTTLLLAPLAGVIAVLWVTLQDGRSVAIVGASLAVVAMLFNSLMVIADAILQGLSKLSPIAPAWIIGRIVLVASTIAAVELGGTILSVYVGQMLGFFTVMAMLFVSVRRLIGPWPMWEPLSHIRTLLKDSVPYASVSLFGSVYLLADVIMLEYMRGQEEVAVYRVASLAVVHLPILSFLVLRGLYPRMARHRGQPGVAGEELSFAVRMLMGISLPLAVGGMLVAEPLVVTVVDPRYAAAVLPMMWLLPMVPLRFMSNVNGMTMTALGLQSLRAKGFAVAAVGNIALNLWLIPLYGATAAAMTTLAADIFLVVFQAIVVRRVARGTNYLGPVLRLLPALAAMAAVVWLTPSLHVLVRVPVGGLAYGVVVVLTRQLTRQDLARLVRT